MKSEQIWYPQFRIHPQQGIIPYIALPQNWRELTRIFDYNEKRITIENYVGEVQKMLKANANPNEIRLIWHNQFKGLLAHIGLGLQSSLDISSLDENSPRYVPHNLGWTNGLIISTIAINYVNELTKCEEQQSL